MWFLITNVYQNKSLSKLKIHELWIENITLAVIYKEFTVAAFDEKNQIDWKKYLDNLNYEWNKLTLAYLAGQNHFSYSDIDNLNETQIYNLLIKLIYKNKEDIFYTFVKHYGTSNAMYDEIEKSVINSDGKLPERYDRMYG